MSELKRLVLILVVIALLLAGCTDADVASYNLSKSADNFGVVRRIVFYNGITGDYILQVEGLCSISGDAPLGEIAITCKTGVNQYKKHFLGLSDNVTYFAEQMDSAGVDVYHYKVIFKPSVIVPDIDVQLP